MNIIKKSFLAICLLALPIAASANIVTNDSFELPNLSGGWSLLATDGVAGGWYAEGQAPLEIGNYVHYGITGYTGEQVLELDSTANYTASQNLTTLSGWSYTIDFDSARRNNRSIADCNFDVLWNNVIIGSYAPTSTAMSATSLSVIGTGADKLSFRGTGPSTSYGALIDNVIVEADFNTQEAVPEPTSMGALGLAAIGAYRRRKMKKA